MINASLLDKIKTAEENFTDEDSIKVIEEWKKTIATSQVWGDLSKNEAFQQIIASMKKRFIQIKVMLATSRDKEVMINQDKWWAVLDELKYWIEVMNKDPQKVLSDLEEEVESELKRM